MVTGSLIILSIFGLIGLIIQLAQNSAILKVQDTNRFMFDLINKKDLDYLSKLNGLSNTINSVQEQSEQRVKDVLGITNNIGLELNNLSSHVTGLDNELNGLLSKEVEEVNTKTSYELDELNEFVKYLDGWSVLLDDSVYYLSVRGHTIRLGASYAEAETKVQSIITGVSLSQLNSQNKTNKEV